MSDNVSMKIPRSLLDRIKTIRRLKAAKEDKDTILFDVMVEMVESAEKRYGVGVES